MDHEPRLPSADDLGITDVEYERIVRALRRRAPEGRAVPAPPSPPPPAHKRRRALRWIGLAAPVVICAGVLLPRIGATSDEPAYAFLDMVGDRPVTYSSCHPVQVAVYPAGGPPDAERLVREAVAQLRTVTGLDIVVTGVFGGHAPNWNFEAAPVHPDDPISVSWQDGDAIAEITDHIAGIGGSRVIQGPHGTEHLGAGTIALSREYYRLLTGRGDHAEALAVLLHEFGHVLGLAHVNSPHELMYKHNVGLTELGPGDIQGLSIVGHGPCT